MELIERPHLDAVKYLNSISFKDFRDDCIRDAEDNGDKKPLDKDIKTWYSVLKHYCKTAIKTKGNTKRIYSHSLDTPAGQGGRLFSGGSLQSIWCPYRGLLMRGRGTDIDMENCHPVILRFICKKHKISCPSLEYYINHRDECLSQFATRKIGKNAYLIATNSEKISRRPDTNDTFKRYDREMKDIQNKLLLLPDYRDIIERMPDYKMSQNFNGSVINRILCKYENEILQEAIHVINTRGLEIAILMFDGLMIYGNHYDDDTLLRDIERQVETKFAGLSMKWAYKEIDDELEIPDDFDINDAMEESFQNVKERFEEHTVKIISSGTFISVIEDDPVIMSRTHLQTSYEHLSYTEEDKKGDLVKHNFLKKWIQCEDMRTCVGVGIYPKESMMPKKHFNMWRQFEMESVTVWKHHQDALDMFKNHIKILCDHNDEVYQYFLKWIAHMIQYPEQKSICPVLISDEGAGKGTLLKLFSKMFGSKKVFSTQDPAKHVWGDFNGQMASAFLVNLDELSKRDTMESEGKIKGLITEPTLMINIKGVKAYPIQSYHRFMVTTNGEEPMNTSNGDRRKMMIRSSDELINNKQYFETINKYLDDVNAVKTCFEYFKTLPDVTTFLQLKMPVTEYQEELKTYDRSPIDRWLQDFVSNNSSETEIILTSSQAVAEFSNWCANNRLKYYLNSIQLMVRLSRLKLGGVSKKRGVNNTALTVFNIPSSLSHYAVGCVVDLENAN